MAVLVVGAASRVGGSGCLSRAVEPADAAVGVVRVVAGADRGRAALERQLWRLLAREKSPARDGLRHRARSSLRDDRHRVPRVRNAHVLARHGGMDYRPPPTESAADLPEEIHLNFPGPNWPATACTGPEFQPPPVLEWRAANRQPPTQQVKFYRPSLALPQYGRSRMPKRILRTRGSFVAGGESTTWRRHHCAGSSANPCRKAFGSRGSAVGASSGARCSRCVSMNGSRRRTRWASLSGSHSGAPSSNLKAARATMRRARS